jgi:hypothetical protein
MSEEKKSWTKPQLIVLGRGRPEESILYTCKQINQAGDPGPDCIDPTDGKKCNAQNFS